MINKVNRGQQLCNVPNNIHKITYAQMFYKVVGSHVSRGMSQCLQDRNLEQTALQFHIEIADNAPSADKKGKKLLFSTEMFSSLLGTVRSALVHTAPRKQTMTKALTFYCRLLFYSTLLPMTHMEAPELRVCSHAGGSLGLNPNQIQIFNFDYFFLICR